MSKIQSLFVVIAVAALAFSSNANADVVVDLSGMDVFGDVPTELGPITATSGTVTEVIFDFNYQPLGLSWASELEIGVVGPNGSIQGGTDGSGGWVVDLEFGGNFGADLPLVFNGSSALANGAAAGDWTVSLFDNFDDGGSNGVFGEGSTITIVGANTGTGIPEPTAVALLSIAGLGLFVRRRRN